MKKKFDSPQIQYIESKLLVGKRIETSFGNDRTFELWKSFMPNRKNINNALNSNLISLQIYPTGFNFQPESIFEKWACAEVSNHLQIPDGMEKLILPAGDYAVFHYRGPASDKSIFQFIFKEWLPASGLQIDERPHFEILGEKFNKDSPESEEDIYIPVIKK